MSDKRVVDDVKVTTPASEKGLTNGLGLEQLFPKGKKPSSPAKVEVKAPEEKVEEPKPTPKPPVPSKKAEVKKETPKEDEKPADLATLSKQLKDTRDYATQVNQKNKDLERSHSELKSQMEILKQKLEGNYVDPPPLSPAEAQKVSAFQARVKVDDQVMREQFGADTIQQLIWDSDGPYMQLEMSDPAIRARIVAADRPVYEAYQVVQEHEFFQKYGRDPEKIKQAIINEAREEFVKELQGEMRGKTGDGVHALSRVNSVPRDAEPKGGTPGVKLKSIFTNFQPTTNSI